MSALLIASSALLAAMLAVALANLATAPRLERARGRGSRRRVSLLVPARDEAENLRAGLPLLLAQDHPELEVLVLDDGSADGTGAVARAIAAGDARLRVLEGAPLPTGWLGKCWACHQLAAAATGDVLLFCDADVRAAPDAVARTVALMEERGAGAATAILRQETGSWAERAVVPLVTQLPPLATLPLRLVPAVAAPSLSMANGQWLGFTRAAYERCGGHAAVRGEVAEDVALGRAVKRAGDRLVVAVAARALRVRMYRGAAEVRAGFAKNLYALLGGRPAGVAVGVAIWVTAAVVPCLAPLHAPIGWLPLGLLLGVRLVGAALFRQGWREVALHPVGAVMVLALAVESAARAGGGRATWKGRPVAAAGPANR